MRLRIRSKRSDFITQTKLGYDTPVLEAVSPEGNGSASQLHVPSLLFCSMKPRAHWTTKARRPLAVQLELDGLCRERTALVIAHRLFTIRDADILVFDQGEIIELGTHDQLAATGGAYVIPSATEDSGRRGAGWVNRLSLCVEPSELVRT